VDLEALPIDDAMQALLSNMCDKMKLNIDKEHPLIYEELQNGIKKWPEKTTTSPSGRHLGIYKSLQWHVLTKEALEALSPTQSAAPLKQGRDVLFLIFDIMSLALLHTYTLNRWKMMWTLFIEKELGNLDLNRLRCIMIFEADWQLILKWHSSYGFLPKSESANVLTTAQGGGRKGRSAIDQSTQQVIKMELIKLNQRSALDMFLDARWCFDLMVEACHNMACRRHGAADDYLHLHAQTHHSMKYYVRHKFGVLEDYNTFDQHPWHGAGQGTADAALRYIMLSDSLIDAYHTKIQPWAIKDLTLTLTVFKSMKAFIDDVAMLTGGDHLSFEQLTQQAKTQLQWWNNLIRASGGALNPTKCCCAPYTWTPDTAGILRLDTTVNDAVIAPCPNQLQQTIPVLKPNKGTRYLGIYVTCTCNTKPMQDQIWQKALLYTKAFQRTHMSRREAGVLYHLCFLPALTYSFPAMGLPATFLERIHKLSTSTILNKMGYHRNLPRSFVFAPRHMGGIGLRNLIHEQSAQQMIILLRHMHAHTPLGLAMETLVRTYQLWAGLCNYVLSDTQPCPWVPSQWLSFLRQSMHANRIQISYNSWNIPPLRVHNRFIMEDFNAQDFPRSKMERSNACRMYLQVTTLSEITDHTGLELLPQILMLKPHEPPKGLTNISYSTLQWPRVHCPSTSCWRLWTSTVCTLYTGSAKGICLTQPLGWWFATYDKYRFWHWRMLDTDHLVYQNHPSAPTRVALTTMCR